MSELFEIRAPQVTSSIVEGEAVIINLDTGNYYSTDGLGGSIWAMVRAGIDKTHIISAIRSHYGDKPSPDAITAAVDHFFDVLLTEGLVVRADETQAVDALDADGLLPASATFEEPALYKYDDMNELLLLDPIHDVDESGWPKTPADAQDAERNPGTS